MKFANPCRNERGAVLVVGLIFMAILSILGTAAYLTTSNELKISSNYKTGKQALYIAEAGIQEALHRLNLDSGDSDFIGETGTPTPGWGRYIVLQAGADMFKEDPDWDLSDSGLDDNLDNDDDGSTDEADETYPETATIQTVDGTELSYRWVKLYYKIEDSQFNNGTDNDEVVLYGQDFGYGADAPTEGISPVIVVTSTGTAENNCERTVTVELSRAPLDIGAEAAVACDNPPTFGGNTFVSGFNHDLSTSQTDDAESTVDITGADLPFDGNGIDNHGGEEKHPATVSCDANTTLSGQEDTLDVSGVNDEVGIPYGGKIENDVNSHLPGAWTTGDTVTGQGSDDIYGGNNVDPWKDEDAGNPWLTLAQLLGLTDAQLQDVLDKADVTYSDTVPTGGNVRLDKAPQAVIYIDNAATGKELKITSSTPSYDDGWGLMYVTGDMEAQNLTFKGLIYVEGTVRLTGNFWVLGSLAVQGETPFSSGGGIFLYSKEALDQKVGNAMDFVILSWKEG